LPIYQLERSECCVNLGVCCPAVSVSVFRKKKKHSSNEESTQSVSILLSNSSERSLHQEIEQGAFLRVFGSVEKVCRPQRDESAA
jgi:hypothetical protein